MANILKTIIENDKGEIRRLEKMADKVFKYEDQMAALTDDQLKAKQLNLKNVIKMENHWIHCFMKHLRLSVKVPNVS